MISNKAPSSFPFEILLKIICELWSSQLTVEERIAFMIASVCVSTTWKDAFLLISARDVHVPCPSYVYPLMRILSGVSAFYGQNDKHLPNTLCRSLTIHVRGPFPAGQVMPLTAEETQTLQEIASTSTSLLYTLHSTSFLPHLRHVVLELVDIPFDDIVEQRRLLCFPEQVRRLDIEYAFVDAHGNIRNKNIPVTAATRDGATTSSIPPYQPCAEDERLWDLLTLRELHILGADGTFVADIASTCHTLEKLVTDAPCLDALAPIIQLPSWVEQES